MVINKKVLEIKLKSSVFRWEFRISIFGKCSFSWSVLQSLYCKIGTKDISMKLSVWHFKYCWLCWNVDYVFATSTKKVINRTKGSGFFGPLSRYLPIRNTSNKKIGISFSLSIIQRKYIFPRIGRSMRKSHSKHNTNNYFPIILRCIIVERNK